MATPQESSEEGIACSSFERHHSSLSQSMTSPYTVVRICQILYSKRCVDESVLGKVESANTSLDDKKRALMGAIEKAVSDDQRKLHELATVLDQFKETKSVANNIISDYKIYQQNALKKFAQESVTNHTSSLIEAISGSSFQSFITSCEEKKLITSNLRGNLLDTSTSLFKDEKASILISEIRKVVHFKPSCLDTVLCILIDTCGIPGTVVAEAVANDYGHMLPNYEKTKPTTGTVGGATSVISSDDNVEEMVPQYDQMSNEDRASDILRTHYSTLSQSLKDPVNIARLLHKENVIPENAVAQVDLAAIKDRTTVLLGSLRRAIHNDHLNLDKFGRALQRLTAGNERVGQDIINDYNEAFPIENVFSKSQDEYTSMVQSSTSRATTEGTSVNVTIDPEMMNEFTKIKGKFGLTFYKIKITLTNYDTPVDDVKCFCIFTYPECSQEINDCQTMENVLTFVAKKCTLIDIGILEKLLEVSEHANEAKQHIKDYQQAIDDFSQKMRGCFPSLLPDGTPHPLRGETITFVMKWIPKSVSLNDIENLQIYAFGSLFKNVKVIMMEPGKSVIITCSFPFELTGLLMAEAMKNLKLLKNKGLLKLTIGYCTIWNIRDEEEKEETTDVQSTNEKVTSERERELEQPLQGTDKLNEIISHKDKEVKELQEKVDPTVGDTSDITDQQRDTESELVGQTDETIEELQQPLPGKEDQTFPSQTTPPSLSNTPSDKQVLKQQIKAMNVTMQSPFMKSKEEREIEATREIEMLQDKLSEKGSQLLTVKEQTSVAVEKYRKEHSWRNWKIEFFLHDKNVTVTRGNIIAHGSFKVVYEACDKDDDIVAAWYEVDVHVFKELINVRLSTEINLLQNLKHPNILQLLHYQIFNTCNSSQEDTKVLVLLTEYMSELDLKSYIMNNPPYLSTICKWGHQILMGLKFLHEQEPAPVIHRNLKCENLLFNEHENLVKIGGFGLASTLEDKEDRTIVGTVAYRAPEVFTGKYNESIDIYSFGLCLLEMYTRETPYRECHDNEEIRDKIIKHKLPLALKKVDNEELKVIIVDCLKLDPAKRPTAKKLSELDYFKDN